MKNESNEEKAPFVSHDRIFEDVGFSPAEALELKVSSEIYRELLRHIREKGYAQSELGRILGIHQPDVSHLMNGRVSRFSLGKLIQFAAKLNLTASVKITPVKSGPASLPATVRLTKKRLAASF